MSCSKHFLSLVLASICCLQAFAQNSLPLPDRSVLKLLWDASRGKIYALNPGYGLQPGTLIAVNPTNGTLLAEIALGSRPTDMAATSDGRAIYAINTGSRTLMKVDLDSFSVVGTRSFGTPNTYDPANPLHITTGRSNLVYFTDGGWSPGVYVYDFELGQALSDFDDDTGAGGLLATRDGNTLFIWHQYGWGAGSVNSWVTRLDASGTNLVPVQDSFSSWRRDPFDTPLLLNGDESVLFNKQQMFVATNLSVLIREFPENIYSITRRGDVAVGNSKIFGAWSGDQLAALPFASSVQTVAANDQVLAIYKTQPSELDLIPLASLLGAGWETNKVPVPAFSRTPTNATTRTLIVFDASPSVDDQGSSALQYRWDWENDGTPDTAFTNWPKASFKYSIPGTKTAALQVKDAYGAVATATQTFDVVQEDDPGQPGGGNASFEVQFPAADIAFDPQRPYAYVSGWEQKTLVFLNLTNGLIERQFTFDNFADSIAMTPNAQRLYVALLRRPHQYYGSGGHTNYVAEFNLQTGVKIREFMIDADPSDLAATDSGILVVPGGSDQWTDIRTYRIATGQLLGTRGIRHLCRMSLHPSQYSVYTADTDLSPSDIQHYLFDPVTGDFTGSWDSPYHGDYPMSGGVWCSPTGTNVISRGAVVLTSSTNQTLDLSYYRNLAGGTIEEASFDTNHGALFTVGNNRLWHYNLKSFELVSDQAVSNNTRYVFSTSSHLYMAAVDSGRTVFQRILNPAAGAETNKPPVAEFTYSPTNATTLRVLTFDGGLSADDQGGGNALSYRWDWESDGVYDTSFTNEPVALHRFNIPGTKTVTLQVKDRYGALATALKTINVSQEDDPGTPGGGNPAFELQFAATDIAFDPLRPFAFITSKETKKLVILNLTNGFIERQFTFDYMPESIAISPNGLRMYVALLTREHSYYWWDEGEGHKGYIAEFDLTTRAKTRDFMINEDPYDLAVTDSGILVVPGGSGQWTSIRTYRAPTGEQLGTAGIRQMSHIRMHLSQTAVYTADTDSSPSDIRRYNFDPVTGALGANWDSPYHGDYPMSGDVWCHPSGAYVFVRGGGVFTSSPVQFDDMRFIQNLPGGGPFDMSFDLLHNAAFAIGNGKLWHYNLTNLQLVTSQPITGSARFVHASERDIYVAAVANNRTSFLRLQNPALPEPSILEQPISQQVLVGGSVFLNVTVSGEPPFAYQWYQDTFPLTNGLTTSMLLSSITPSQAGNYFVIVTNAYGAVTSSVAVVTVKVPPAITQDPQSVTVFAGGTANMSAQANGTAPLRFQWTLEGADLPGQTNSTMVITNTQARHDGVYRVVVQNELGSVVSAPAILRVIPAAPVVIASPADATWPAGSDADVAVTAAGSEPIYYQWEFQGIPLTGATASVLKLRNLQTNHAGLYTVQVLNASGSARSTPALITVVPSPPHFTSSPESWSGAAGTSVTLAATARGSEPLAYFWQWNGTNLPNGTTQNLTLTNVALEQSGPYTVVASNTFGSVTSLVASIVVTAAPPVFVIQPFDAAVAPGGAFTLTVLASGSQPLGYQWYFLGAKMAGLTSPSLVVNNVNATNAGDYFAIASNQFGLATSRVATVTVRSVPVFTEGLSNLVIDAGSTLRLSVSADGNAPLSFSWRFQNLLLPGQTDSSLSISNVQKVNSGVYSVTASNAYGVATSFMFLKVFAPAGRIVVWGDNAGGQLNAPDATNIVDVAGGDFHSLALRRDGRLTAWGFNGERQVDYPTNYSDLIGIAAGAAHSLGVRLNGSILSWGRNDSGQTTVPSSAKQAVAVAAGEAFSLALLRDGSVVAWGDNSFRQTDVPHGIGFVTALAAGRAHALALINNGSVVGWGFNACGQASPPAGLIGVKAIAAGYLHSLALRENGTVVAWGDNTWGQSAVPAGLTNAVAIAAGDVHSLALLSTGEVIAWGDNSFGQRQLPDSARGLVAVSAGYYHNVAISTALLLRLKFQPLVQKIVLSWDGNYRLQSAPLPDGPYEDVFGPSPFTNDCTAAPSRFFRLRQPE